MSDETRMFVQVYVQKGGDLVMIAESDDKTLWMNTLAEMIKADAAESDPHKGDGNG
jgi:hypothetical protein